MMQRADFESFRAYPRGFLGAHMDVRIENAVPKPAPRFVYQTDLSLTDAPVSTIVPNPDVETLYAKYIRNSAESLSFNFRKLVWITALHAFGTNDFRYWYEQQHLSPRAGDMHRRFLEDTLKFIVTGRRELDVVGTWNTLVTLNDTTDRAGRVTDCSRQYLEDLRPALTIEESRVRPAGYIDVTDVIQRWCSQPNGVEDLLLSLHVLFGDN